MGKDFEVQNPAVKYSEDAIESVLEYTQTFAEVSEGGHITVTPQTTKFVLKTDRRVPRTGCMLVGIGGNNGTTVVAGAIANREGITWRTQRGVQTPNYWGSLTQSSTLRLGTNSNGDDVVIPFKKILPMIEPNDLIFSGWDLSKANLAEAMERAEVLPYDLQRQLVRNSLPFLNLKLRFTN